MRSDNPSHLIALVGPPNAGKTTLYNWLTESNFKTVNYPGSTVEFSIGKIAPRYQRSLSVMDTPGTYSLMPKSPDEEVTLKSIYEGHQGKPVDAVIAVVDGTQLARHLFLAKQIQSAGFPVVIALTMKDLLEKTKTKLNLISLSNRLGVPIVAIDGRLGGGVPELLKQVDILLESPKAPSPVPAMSSTQMESLRKELESIAKSELKTDGSFTQNTAKIDKILLGPISGGLIFAFTMFAVFSSIFWAAKPLMDLIDSGVGQLAAFVPQAFPNGGLWADFLANGMIASFGSVVVFVPQVFILFFGIGLLEDTGYLARAATIIDKPFSKMGMSGRSFVPLLSGFACAVPAMMATRNISSPKDRWITMSIIPLMACSARLPVYALLLSFVFYHQPAWKPGIAMAALYLGSILVGILAAILLNQFKKQEKQTLFMMELPIYRLPKVQNVLKNSFERTKAYLGKAGPVIFILSLIVWAGMTFPNFQAQNPERLETSYAGYLGKKIEPIFSPMGVDWKVGVGLISAFAAREVFVSTLAVLFNISETENPDGLQDSLITKMQGAVHDDGQKIFTLATVAGLIVYFMIALQCLSTFGVAIREMNSTKFAVIQLVTLNILGYGLAVFVVHSLRFLGVA